jgi:hypothetical protein
VDCTEAAIGAGVCPPAHVVVYPTNVGGLNVSYDSGWYTIPVPNALRLAQESGSTAVCYVKTRDYITCFHGGP